MQNWATRITTAAALLAAAVTTTACQKADRDKQADPDQEIMDRTKKTLGGVYEIINDLSVDCVTADGRLNVYAKDHALDFKWIQEQHKGLESDKTPRAQEVAKKVSRLVGNNTPAFRRFAKRCPTQAVTLEKTLDKLGGAMAKKLGLVAPPKPPVAASRPKPTTPTPPAASGTGDEVGPPKASDLPRYLEGLEGKGDKIKADIETSMGTFHCEIFDDKVPMTAANFIGLARGLKAFRHPRTGAVEKRPYFDGIVFHRVIPNFMLQTGDPLGHVYKFADEFHPQLRHSKPGRLSMANSGPGTNGSQFFITEKETPHLDNKHTVFGQCKEIALIKEISRVPKDQRNRSRPATPVTIKHVKIYRGK